MKKRLGILFYTFLIIFAATSIISLLGVTKVIFIDKENLRWLLGAFVIELAGAVIALFRNAPFFASMADVVTSMEGSLKIIDELMPEMEAVYSGKTQAELNRQYGIIMRKEHNDIVAYQRMQIITGAEIESLPQEQKEVIETNVTAMNKFKDRWDKLYSQRAEANSESERQKVDEKLAFLVKGMKEEFHSILDILIRKGLVLEDHYRNVRDIVDGVAANKMLKPSSSEELISPVKNNNKQEV